MISLDLMKSSEVRIAGDRSNCFFSLKKSFHVMTYHPTYLLGKCLYIYIISYNTIRHTHFCMNDVIKVPDELSQ